LQISTSKEKKKEKIYCRFSILQIFAKKFDQFFFPWGISFLALYNFCFGNYFASFFTILTVVYVKVMPIDIKSCLG
jgi:hypothetical protein